MPETRVITWGYNADYAHFLSPTSTNTVRDHARSLSNALSGLRNTSETCTRPIIFITYNLGGIICAQVIFLPTDPSTAVDHDYQSLLQSSTIEPDDVEKFSDHTNGVVFMGTPFGGSDTTEWASFFERLLQVLPVGKFNKTLLEHLKKDSHQLKILGEEFPQWLNNRRHAEERKVRVMCFFEEFPVPGVGHVVTRESARIAGYEAVSLPGDHRGICKFDNFQDPKYKTVLNTLRTWVDEIKAESKSKEIVDVSFTLRYTLIED